MAEITRLKSLEMYKQVTSIEDIRALCLVDLFFLAVKVCNREDMNNDFVYERCREIQKNPNGYLDLWAREHYKSTIITVFKTIQDILKNPNVTFGFFSHVRPIAKAFLRQIKREFETNEVLQEAFPHICKPSKGDNRTWSEDGGLIVKRDGNPKEATVEAWGLVDGQPTGKHFDYLIFDDVVTLESVSTPEQIKKTTDAWRLSLNLGARGGAIRMIGTRYHALDTYYHILEQGSVIERRYPATVDGTEGGEPIFIDKETLAKKRRDMGSYVFACQMLQDPLQDGMQSFNKDWLQYWIADYAHFSAMNRAIYVDPAHSKKDSADYTTMWVIGRNIDGKYYVMHFIRDRLKLAERTEKLFSLVSLYGVRNVAYEQYGMQSDIEHIQAEMKTRCYHFNISPVGGKLAKNERIKRLEPDFEQGNIFLPNVCNYMDYQGKMHNLVDVFINEEYLLFPMSSHDDMLDSLARIYDMPLSIPNVERVPQKKKEKFSIWK